MSLFLITLGKPVVLVHVPKTGGTSIRAGRQESMARFYKPDEAWLSLPSFGIVRDPMRRLESCWKDFRYLRKLTNKDFPEFVDWVESVIDTEQYVDLPMTMEHHVARQTHPIHGLQYAKYVGRTERLEQDFNSFCFENNLTYVRLDMKRYTGAYPNPIWNFALENKVKDLYKEDYKYLKFLGKL